MFCSGIVLSLCQIVRIYRGSNFQANIKVGMHFFSKTCWSYFLHSTSVWLTEIPYHGTWKDASTIDHRYIHTGIIQRVCMTCFFGCIDLFVCCAEVFFSFPSNRRSGHVVCWIEHWHLYNYTFLKRWGDEVADIGRCQTPVIYPLLGKRACTDWKGWILLQWNQTVAAPQLPVCQPSPSSVWCWRACRGRCDFYICFHFWQFVWSTIIILLRYPMNLHNWLHAISCLKNHWVEVWR